MTHEAHAALIRRVKIIGANVVRDALRAVVGWFSQLFSLPSNGVTSPPHLAAPGRFRPVAASPPFL